jgi:hypothetical protein
MEDVKVARTYRQLVFEGPMIESGELGAMDLGESLLGLSRLVQIANEAAHPDSPYTAELRIIARPVRGSFILDLALILTGIPTITTLWVKGAREVIGAAKDAMETMETYLTVKKLLREDSDATVKEGPEGVVVTINGNVQVMEASVAAMLGNPEASRQVERFAAAVKSGMANSVALIDPDPSGGRETVRITTEDAQEMVDLKLPSSTKIEEIGTARIREALTLVKIPLKRPADLKWTVETGDESRRSVKISDAEFLHRMNSGEERFAVGDVLIVETAQTSRLVDGKPSVDYEVVKVIDHRRKPVQLRLSGD